MRISLSDPADASAFGAWTNPDPIDMEAALQGEPFILQHDSTSSHGVDELYDLAAGPTFHGPVVARCRISDDGVLHMFLAAEPDDETHPLADLAGFSDMGGGTGQLFLPNRLPPDIGWSVAP